MHVLLIDGHPDAGRLSAHLLDHYAAQLPPGHSVQRVAVRDLTFDPILHKGYAEIQELEPDLLALAEALRQADHVVMAFPLWWGAEPALLKGLFDRLLLPGFAFRYHDDDPLWDRLLAGRSCDLLVTMDTPRWYLKIFFADAAAKRLERQVLGFCGLKPITLYRIGPVSDHTPAQFARWNRRVARAARRAARLSRGGKSWPDLPGPPPAG